MDLVLGTGDSKQQSYVNGLCTIPCDGRLLNIGHTFHFVLMVFDAPLISESEYRWRA